MQLEQMDLNLNLLPELNQTNIKKSLLTIKYIKFITTTLLILLGPNIYYFQKIQIVHTKCKVIEAEIAYLQNEIKSYTENTEYIKKSYKDIENFNKRIDIINLLVINAPKKIQYTKLTYKDSEVVIDCVFPSEEAAIFFQEWLHRQLPIKNLLINNSKKGHNNVIYMGIQFSIDTTKGFSNNQI